MTRRAMTLVEVLAATVLLALLAGACLPLMQQSMRSLREADAVGFDARELSLLADAFVAEPQAFTAVPLEEMTQVEIAWPETADRDPVRVERLVRLGAPADDVPAEEKPDHAWLAFSCGPLTVCRWVPIEEQEGEP